MMVPSEGNTPTSMVVRYKRSLRKSRAAREFWYALAGAMAFSAATIGGMLLLANLAASLVFGVLMIAGFYLTEIIIPHLRASKRIKLLSLQTKMANGESADLYADTQKLIQGYMALKEYATAEHYSQLLLKQSSLPEEQRDSKLNEMVASSDCWVSTPEYHNSWNYRLLWAFESRGRLTLDQKKLAYESDNLTFEIDLADIRSAEVVHHGWCLHMARFKYLLLKFKASGNECELYLSPTASDKINVWYVNDGAQQWCDLIKVAKHKRGITRVVDSMRAQIADVESNTGQTKV